MINQHDDRAGDTVLQQDTSTSHTRDSNATTSPLSSPPTVAPLGTSGWPHLRSTPLLWPWSPSSQQGLRHRRSPGATLPGRFSSAPPSCWTGPCSSGGADGSGQFGVTHGTARGARSQGLLVLVARTPSLRSPCGPSPPLLRPAPGVSPGSSAYWVCPPFRSPHHAHGTLPSRAPVTGRVG